MGYLENKAKKGNEPNDQEVAKTTEEEPAEVGPGNEAELQEVSEGDEKILSGEAYDETAGEVRELLADKEDLEAEIETLQERIAELEGEGGDRTEGWIGPHQANELREENQHLKIQVQRLNKEVTRLRQQIRLGNR